MRDPYCYPGTNILKNKLNIQNEKEICDAEADYVSLRLRELAEHPLPGKYDITHFMEMHKYIFQDIYEWAGNFRIINIEKDEPALGGLSIEYSDVSEIENDLSGALEHMSSRPWQSYSLDEIAQYFSADIASVWKVHGFREGNTGLVITFCCQFMEEQGIPIKREIFEKYSVYVRTSLVAYCAIFHDLGNLSQKEYLEKIIMDSLSI